MQDRLEDVLAICTRVLFYKNGFTIAKFKLAESGKEVSFKGNYYAIQDVKYYISGKDSQDPKYPDTYWADVVRRDIDFSNMDKQGVSDYLHSIVAESIADAMIEQLDDPIKVLNDGDVKALTEVKGVGEFRASSILETHMNQIDISPLITELKPYKLTNKAIYKVLEHYNNSIDLAIKEIKSNPYNLSDVPGFGFMKADTAFLNSHNYSQSAMKDKRRIEAYVKYLFEEEFLNGNTWINGMQLQEKVKKYIGEVDWSDLMNHINTSDEYMIIKGVNGTNRITTKENASLEYDTANMLVERVQSENNFKILNIDSTIEKVEKRQGFDFNDDQRDAMRLVFDSNISLIQGLAGSGKTTMMNGIINTYRDNGYSVISTALSGKASDNIMKATSNQAKTLHSLLMYGTPQQFNLQKPLEYDIIVLEELSMVDLRIFNALLKAMKPKSKLIMLGDSKQLESISVGVMNSIIYSNIIPSFTLTKIQRQAQGSAIITHSVPIREGYLNDDVVVKSNTNKRYGEYQDLEYVFLSNNAEESMYKYTLKRFKDSIEMYGVENTQILSATKNAGKNSTYHLNTVAQMIANPSNVKLKEFKITFGKDNEHYILREGDRIINTKNDRTITDVDGNTTPIYNGNTGKLLRIEDDGKDAILIIDMDGIGTVSVPVNEKDNKIQLGYAITIHKCLSEDTLLITNKGIKTIKELDNGANVGEFKEFTDDLLVFNGEKLEKPKAFYNNGVDEVFSITTNKGYNLEATKEHGLQVISDGSTTPHRVNAKDIKEGDNVLISLGAKVFNKEYQRFENDTLDQSHLNVRSAKYNRPEVVDEKVARFLGYMVGDGTVAKNAIKFSKRHLEVTSDFKQLVKDIFGYDKQGLDNNTGIKYRKSGDYMYEVCSMDIADFCSKIDGLQPNNKYVPKIIMESPENVQYEFLKGLFEDGSVNVNKGGTFDHIEFSSSEYKLIQQVQNMLLNMGILTTFDKREKHSKKYNKTYYSYTLYIYKFFAQVFDNKIGFVSNTKKERLSRCHEDFGNSVNDRHSFYKTNNGEVYFIDKVKAITKDTKQTYCLEMAESGTFVQNGFYGFNCQGSTIKSVIVSLPFHYMLNSRQLLYTAITRASDYCCLITTPKTITSTLKKDASNTEQVNLGYFIDMIYNKEGKLENGQ